MSDNPAPIRHQFVPAGTRIVSVDEDPQLYFSLFLDTITEECLAWYGERGPGYSQHRFEISPLPSPHIAIQTIEEPEVSFTETISAFRCEGVPGVSSPFIVWLVFRAGFTDGRSPAVEKQLLLECGSCTIDLMHIQADDRKAMKPYRKLVAALAAALTDWQHVQLRAEVSRLTALAERLGAGPPESTQTGESSGYL